MTSDLTGTQRAMLDFEGGWWRYPGAKEQEIRKRFGVSATRYYQQLNALIDDPAAAKYAPMVVKRLRRLRDQRRRRSRPVQQQKSHGGN